MHGSVMQNEKYIKFAEDNTVEVMSYQNLDKGIQAGDRKAETYDAKDKDGKPVKYLKEFPNLTVAELNAFSKTKAGQYNQTGKIPYTAIINPHTLEQMQGLSGGRSAKSIMELVLEHKETLNKKHGASLKRSVLRKFDEESVKLNAVLEKSGAAKAFTALKKVDKKFSKEGRVMAEKVGKLRETVMTTAEAELDKAEELIDEGDVKRAKKILTPLSRALKGSALAERATSLLAKTKPAPK